MDRPLAARLLAAAEWFDVALRDRLAAAGWPSLSRNQSQVFPLLRPGGTSQTEIARRLGITRQSAHTLLGRLVELGILERRGAVEDGRLVLVHLTPTGRRLAEEAARILRALEDELGTRVGVDHLASLRAVLDLDWGGPLPRLPRAAPGAGLAGGASERTGAQGRGEEQGGHQQDREHGEDQEHLHRGGPFAPGHEDG